jgi:hypothetical protein
MGFIHIHMASSAKLIAEIYIDGKGLYQQACQEEWNKCKKEEE